MIDFKKYAVEKAIQAKCTKCQDIPFCKLTDMYRQLEKPTSKNISQLRSCLFYKPQ